MLLAACSWGQVMEFDGVDQYINVPNLTDDSFDDQITVSAWINPDTLGDYEGIVGMAYGAPFHWIFRTMSSGALAFRAWAGTAQTVTSSAVLVTDAWQHVAVSVSVSGGFIKIYHNGAEVGSAATTITSLDAGAAQNCRIGIYNDGVFSYPIDSSLDDVRIYSTALSSNQIARLALDTCEMYDPTLWTNSTLHAIAETWDTGYGNTNLVGAWRGDRTPYGNGEAIVEVKDKSPEGNHGTLEPAISTGPTWHGKLTDTNGVTRRGVYVGNGSTHEIHNSSFAIPAQQYSASIWFKSNDWGNRNIYETGSSYASSCYINSSKEITANAKRLSGSANVTGPVVVPDVWHHWACSYDNGTLNFYYDGEFIGSDSGGSGNLASHSGYYLLCNRFGGANLNGVIDDLKIWDSVLTSNQLVAAYSDIYPTNATILNMTFDQQDYIIPDLSGNGNDGTAVNSPTIGAAR